MATGGRWRPPPSTARSNSATTCTAWRSSLSQPGDLDDHVEVGRPLTRVDALERRHVVVVATHADADVLLVDFLVVGGVVVPPTARPRLDPGVTLPVDGVPHLRLGVGMEIPRDVAGGNSHAAQHDQREVG